MRVATAGYKSLRVVTTLGHVPLTGSTTIHGPTEPWMEHRKRSQMSCASVLLLAGTGLNRLEVDSGLGFLIDLGTLVGPPRLQAIPYASLSPLHDS